MPYTPTEPVGPALSFLGKPGGTGMNPFAAASLIQTGGGLLGALFAPSPAKKLRLERESAQKMADWRAGKIASTLKPKTPYYQSGNLPQLGDASMRAVMGNLAQRMGPELMAKWGINPMAQPAPAPQTVMPPVGPMVPGVRPPMQGFPGQPQGFPGQEILARRYGLQAR